MYMIFWLRVELQKNFVIFYNMLMSIHSKHNMGMMHMTLVFHQEVIYDTKKYFITGDEFKFFTVPSVGIFY
jgi:hypothetical protein